ncbi:MAG TPA: hypothetical protein DEO89_09060 [Lachnospiraceae bacterium]|nr:hypothetical protein [Lachnospiraceae bacterium]
MLPDQINVVTVDKPLIFSPNISSFILIVYAYLVYHIFINKTEFATDDNYLRIDDIFLRFSPLTALHPKRTSLPAGPL